MLKPFDKQEDVPEALREHYSKREDGKWHADISDDHPAVKHNAKLLSEKTTAEGRVTQLTSDLESARAGNLGRGQVVVTKSDAALLDEYKPLGTPAELKLKVDEHKTLNDEVAKTRRDQSLRQLAKDFGFNEEAFVRLPNLPDFERREKDGKADWVAKVKGEKDVITERPAKEFIESSTDIAPFMSSLKTAPQTKLPTTGAQDGSSASGGDPFTWARNFGKQWNESRPQTDVAAAFGLSKPA